MFPILQIGPLAIQTHGLILLLGLWIGLELAERQANHYQLVSNQIFSLILVSLGGGLAGGRLVFAASNPSVFFENPLNLFSISPQLISLAGGLVFAAASGLAYGWRSGLSLWPVLDCLTSFLAILMVSLGMANFASGDAYGLPANVPWAIYLWGAARHPSQIYETLAALLAALITWPWAAARYSVIFKQPGMRFWIFVATSAASRLLLEAFRSDSVLFLGQFRQAQLIAWFVLAIGLSQIARRIPPAPLASDNPI